MTGTMTNPMSVELRLWMEDKLTICPCLTFVRFITLLHDSIILLHGTLSKGFFLGWGEGWMKKYVFIMETLCLRQLLFCRYQFQHQLLSLDQK